MALKILRGGPPLSPIAIKGLLDGDMKEGLLCGSSQVVRYSPLGDQAGTLPIILPPTAGDPPFQTGI